MNKRHIRGAGLITALAASIIIALLVGAAGMVAVGNTSLAQREAEYSNAMALAEAGANYELWFISENQLTGTPAHQSDAPFTGTVPGIDGTFRVWVTNSDGSSGWAPPFPMILHSEGTVAGVTRKIEMTGSRQSIFDAYATYSLQNTTFSGSGSIVNGGLGTNGTVTSPSVGSAAVNGILTYGHAPTGGDLTGNNVVYGEPENWPTIDQIIVKNPPVGFGNTGWAYLTSNSPLNRSNQNIRTFAASGAALTPSGTVAAGSPWTGTNANSIRIKPGDWSGMREDPSDGKKAIIFPPGDYYFTDIDTGGGTGNKIIMDTAGLTTGTPGTVRIWMNNSTGNDTINVNVYYTANDPSKFRLYYNKCADINVGGNSVYYGGFYAVRTGCTGSITVGGGSTINGSVIGNYISIQGGSTINFPGNGMNENGSDFSLWFGFRNGWKEVPITGAGSIFSDGTNK